MAVPKNPPRNVDNRLPVCLDSLDTHNDYSHRQESTVGPMNGICGLLTCNACHVGAICHIHCHISENGQKNEGMVDVELKKAENRGTMIAEAKARALVPVASQGHLRISFFLSICVEYVFTSSSSAVPTLLRRTQ
ncbi:hypothetical protein CRG98_012521 [Punica granatum]|uniref:Uncharacterized protein n=1 Tax=Punica granatum TaxID=22663 RepID=A0A2I0KFM4_PUNGR|nr:hypothetical protein CRG98_012521 [Punica granatum]